MKISIQVLHNDMTLPGNDMTLPGNAVCNDMHLLKFCWVIEERMIRKFSPL